MILIIFVQLKKQQTTDNFVICILYNQKWQFRQYNTNGTAIGNLTETIFILTDNMYCYCNTIDSSGNMIFAGRINGGVGSVPNPYIYAVYNSSGVLNQNIGTNGTVSYTGTSNGNSGYNSVVTDSNNNIYLAGDHLPNILLNKYDKNGNLIVTDKNIIGGEKPTICLDSNAKIIISTVRERVNTYFDDLYIIRVNSSNFSVDTDFGTNGETRTIIADNSFVSPNILEINEKIIVFSILEDIDEYWKYIILSFSNNYLINNSTFSNMINNLINNDLGGNLNGNLNDNAILLYNITELGLSNELIDTIAANLINQILN